MMRYWNGYQWVEYDDSPPDDEHEPLLDAVDDLPGWAHLRLPVDLPSMERRLIEARVARGEYDVLIDGE